jgi:glycosyltransferase involved in cell wall biosynthesis
VIAPADLTAPVKVRELELSAPIEPIPDCRGFTAVRVLVRRSGRPLGWLTIEEPEPTVESDCIRRALLDHAAALVAQSELAARAPDGAATPPISVVVCTRDRPALLQQCLASLALIDYPQFEVIVVDNASATDETARVAAAANARLVRQTTPGLDWARNRGVEVARYDLIAFTDDDARVDRGWLRAVAEGFREPDVGLVTGMVAPLVLDTEAQLVFELRYGGMGKGFLRRRWDPGRGDWRALLGANHLGVGANMAVRRETWVAVGGFDTGLDVGTPSRGGGDLDFFHRVLVAGVAARYQPDALVWHVHRRDFGGLRHQLRDNGRAFCAYLMTQWAAAARRTGAVTRSRVVRYAAFVWFRLVALAFAPFRRRERVGFWLQLEEIRGFMAGPWAYALTRRNDARLRRAAGPIDG